MRALIFSGLVLCCLTAQARGLPEVETRDGVILGRQVGGTEAYLGIRYAQAPKGDLRWKPPVPVSSWKEPLQAYRYGNPCPQLSPILRRLIGDEDCLNLNVWTPREKGDQPLPVMVFIHGGANSLGASNQSLLGVNLYDGQYLSASGPVVVVSLNYRLGLLGFMAHPDLSRESGYGGSGNYALMDQLLALKWVNENIAAFGGDPSNVTVFGESAGAINTMALMASPLSRGLFHKAVIQSGFLTEIPLAQAEQLGVETGKALSGESADVLKRLRSLPAGDLIRYGDKPAVLSSYSPTIDNHVLHGGVLESFQSGRALKIPAIIGTTADEMVSLAPFVADSASVISTRQYEERVKSVFGEGAGARILERYPVAGSGRSPRRVFETLLTDGFVLCPARRIARAFQSNGTPVYKYVFSHANDFMMGLGAFHGIELGYVFNTHLGTLREYGLSKQVMKYWTSFATTGQPGAPGLAPWPRYSCEDYLKIDTPLMSAQGYREGFCDFWDSLGDLKIEISHRR